jgi:hypothetical protein
VSAGEKRKIGFGFFLFFFWFFQMHDGTAIGRASLAELLAARWYSGKG